MQNKIITKLKNFSFITKLIIVVCFGMIIGAITFLMIGSIILSGFLPIFIPAAVVMYLILIKLITL